MGLRSLGRGAWRGGWPFFLAALALAPGCFGPSEERLNCLSGCAHGKDHCILQASTPAAIDHCDTRGRRCSRGCPE